MDNKCSICTRNTPEEFLEGHHLIPRVKGGKKKIPVCCDCGNQIHLIFTIKELETVYNTLEAILGHEKIKVWIRWIRKKKDFGYCVKVKKRRK